jgi:hypothetical protein
MIQRAMLPRLPKDGISGNSSMTTASEATDNRAALVNTSEARTPEVVAVSSHWLVHRCHPELMPSDQREPVLHENLVFRLSDGVVGLAEYTGM